MYIKDLKIGSFRHLDNVRLGPFARPHGFSDLVTLAGPNGGGKSSILELLAQSLSTMWSLSFATYRNMGPNSFEAEIGLTEEERSAAASLSSTNPLVAAYLAEHSSYFRASNYPAGEYQRNVALYDQVHNVVIQALRSDGGFQLGFFLKPDRGYRHVPFRRESLFDFAGRNTKNYFMNMGFQGTEQQYADMFEFLVQQRYHYLHALGRYHHKHSTEPGESNAPEPSDPLIPYNHLLQRLFPGYSFADKEEDVPSNLFVRIPNGELIPFADLSSGEKEVFFMLSFFLRHDVSNSVIVIDEPELHLHPELGRLMIRTMQEIKPGNQIWLATHNPEIIDEAGKDRVFFVSRDPETRKPTVIRAADEDHALTELRRLFGFSGYIGIARSLVFLEGIDTSSDRKLFGGLLPDDGRNIKIIPSRSSEDLARLNEGILSILESGLGWLKFYLIRDRDYLPKDLVEHYQTKARGRLHVLNRYHIENYLLVDDLIANVQTEIFNKKVVAADVAEKLTECAKRMAVEVLRDLLAFRLNLIYEPKDFSLGKMFTGELFKLADGTWDQTKIAEFSAVLRKRVDTTNDQLLEQTSNERLAELIEHCQQAVDDALAGDGWRTLFPGRNILQEYLKGEGLGNTYVPFQNNLIKELKADRSKVPDELAEIIKTISSGGDFTR
jgi:predicted ATPase